MYKNEKMPAQCWGTWETSVRVTSAALHRCELDLGHVGWHKCEGMQWSSNVSMLVPPPVTA